MSFPWRYLLPWLLCSAAGLAEDTAPDFSREFFTAKYIISMHVTFPAPYEGKRLVVYHSTDPRNQDCLSTETGNAGCMENFVSAVAVVVFTVNRAGGGKPAAASIREVVTLLDQSEGLPDWSPFVMRVKLVNGVGSDLQVFGYDERRAPLAARVAEREAAKAAWRHYRQDLYIDTDRQPFATIEWLHTTTGIRIRRVNGHNVPNGR